jgi:hypothetical protein
MDKAKGIKNNKETLEQSHTRKKEEKRTKANTMNTEIR